MMSRKTFLKGGSSNHSTPSHRRAPKMEKQLARRTGGKLVPGSGSGYQKGDVRVKGVARIEAKTTKNKSFSVTRKMIGKIEEAALPNGELPVMVVEFIDEVGNPEMEVVVTPSYVIDELIGRLSNG